MKYLKLTSSCKNMSKKLKAVVCLGSAFFAAGCYVAPLEEHQLWQPGTVHVEARQTILEAEVEGVSDASMTLHEKFDALERLYIQLAKKNGEQAEEISQISENVKLLLDKSASNQEVQSLDIQLTDLRGTLQDMEQRLFDVEIDGASLLRSVEERINAVSAAASVEEYRSKAIPPGPKPSEVVYGIHLGSYRAKEQIPGSWSAFKRVFSDELINMEAKIYAQNQQGVGNFLRLIAGPIVSRAEAESVCQIIKSRAREQFCVATEFQGELLTQ